MKTEIKAISLIMSAFNLGAHEVVFKKLLIKHLWAVEHVSIFIVKSILMVYGYWKYMICTLIIDYALLLIFIHADKREHWFVARHILNGISHQLTDTSKYFIMSPLASSILVFMSHLQCSTKNRWCIFIIFGGSTIYRYNEALPTLISALSIGTFFGYVAEYLARITYLCCKREQDLMESEALQIAYKNANHKVKNEATLILRLIQSGNMTAASKCVIQMTSELHFVEVLHAIDIGMYQPCFTDVNLDNLILEYNCSKPMNMEPFGLIETDVTILRFVLSNIFSNIEKYSSSFSIYWEIVDTHLKTIFLCKNADDVEFVSDDMATRILNNTHNHIKPGFSAGSGLAACNRVLNGVNSTFEIKGIGLDWTRITFTIIASKLESKTPLSKNKVAIKVLVVDDDEFVCDATQALLESHGDMFMISTLVFTSQTSTRDILDTNADVILMDRNLGDNIYGEELIATLRTNFDGRLMFIHTGETLLKVNELRKMSFIDDVIEKPINQCSVDVITNMFERYIHYDIDYMYDKTIKQLQLPLFKNTLLNLSLNGTAKCEHLQTMHRLKTTTSYIKNSVSNLYNCVYELKELLDTSFSHMIGGEPCECIKKNAAKTLVELLHVTYFSKYIK